MRGNGKRLLALWLCMMIVCQLGCALGAKKPAPETPRYTQSESEYTQDGVKVTGERAMVDFAWLSQVNPDSVGWLYQEETGLSQPVLQASSNDYYRNRGFDGSNVGKKGMAYLDAGANASMLEDRFFIFGSGREGGSLYSLTGYRKQAYLDAHPSLRLLTPRGDWQADVFACVKTVVQNLDKWSVARAEEGFDGWIRRVIEGSEVTPPQDRIPAEGSRIVIFVTIGADNRRDMVFASLRPITYETGKTIDLNKVDMDLRPTDSGWVQMGPYGQKMVYAQNDRLWGLMRYESALTDKFRRFNGGGCGPTAAAMVIANLVDVQDLPKMREHTANELGALLCSCSVNRVYCNHLHPPYHLETGEEYLRYLPVIVADFAAGNNRWGVNSRPITSVGSNMRFFEPLCEVYGLSFEVIPNVYEAMMHMKERGNQGLLLCVALRGGVFTTTSHYVVVAAVDDTHFYVLDPLFRKEYELDTRDTIEEIIAPGVVKVKLENLRECGLNIVGYVEKKTEEKAMQ